MDAFLKILGFTLEIEGGLHRDPKDPGGLTCCGIAKTKQPHWPGWRIVEQLTDEGLTARQIVDHPKIRAAVEDFYREEWKALRCDMLPDRVAMVLFDTSANLGRDEGIRNLQRALGQLEDGKLGARTLKAAETAGNAILPQLLSERARDYNALAARGPDLRYNLGGWMRRLGELGELVFEGLHLWGS